MEIKQHPRESEIHYTPTSGLCYVAEQPVINDSLRAVEQCSFFRNEPQEHVAIITLDNAFRMIRIRVIFKGTLNQCLMHPREIFCEALSDRATSFILIHNHPSGQLKPSSQDLRVTERLVKASNIIGIEMLDHIIVTKTGHYSMKDNGDM